MTHRNLETLINIFTSLKDDNERFYFINDEATAREVYMLDSAGYLKWTSILK